MLNKFAEFWASTGWKMAYASIVIIAIVMLVVMFS